MRVKKILKRDLVSNRQYKTTYKDIKKYFKIINRSIFKNILTPFNDIQLKNINKCVGQVVQWEWKGKGTCQFHLEMLPYYRNKKEFVDTLAHEMVHLYQMNYAGDTGNHNRLFYSFRPKLNRIGIDI
tara:strand:- start:3575 stop:3955 length:381 start_codon:yes stop_codon:yes gene_type:complete